VWDLVSGQRRTWKPDPRMERISCGMDWCGGTATSGRAAVQGRDGRAFVELPRDGTVHPLIGGRFAVLVFDAAHQNVPNARAITGNAIWDLKTGRVSSLGPVVTLDIRASSNVEPMRSNGIVDLHFAWEKGDEVLVLDLNRIR
jgi:hypothetical protein